MGIERSSEQGAVTKGGTPVGGGANAMGAKLLWSRQGVIQVSKRDDTLVISFVHKGKASPSTSEGELNPEEEDAVRDLAALLDEVLARSAEAPAPARDALVTDDDRRGWAKPEIDPKAEEIVPHNAGGHQAA